MSTPSTFLIDTHCHINTMVKPTFDIPLTTEQISAAQIIIDEAAKEQVTIILNVGTSVIESHNCIELAKKYAACFATVGIHPNDATATWQKDMKEIAAWAKKYQELKIVGIGECGIDKHYPDYNLQRQKDVFQAQIELALEYDLALVVHTRDAGDETLRIMDEYKKNNLRGTIHCFSEDLSFAQEAIAMGFVMGIGGTITYPKNNYLRDAVNGVGLNHIILETDAPFLPPQEYRGKQNHPQFIALIARYISKLLNEEFEEVAQKTTKNALNIFKIPSNKH